MPSQAPDGIFRDTWHGSTQPAESGLPVTAAAMLPGRGGGVQSKKGSWK